MSRTDPQFNLRMPIELKEHLEAEAKKNKRSVTAEILAKLETPSVGERFSLEYLLSRDIKHAPDSSNAKIKVIQLEDEVRIIQGHALNYLDVDYSLPLDELKTLLTFGMTALIETNSKFKKWEKINWAIYRGGHHLKFVEQGNLDDLNILFIGDTPIN